MAESDGAWGDLAADDPDLAEQWDGYQRLPEAGANDVLDAFCRSKNLDIPSLIRTGARLAGYDVLVFAFPGGLKFRHMETGQRWASAGAEFRALKIIPARRGE